MRSRALFSALLCLLGNISALAQQPDQKTRTRVEWFIYDAPAKWFGNTRHAITTTLGAPADVSVRLNPNPQDTLIADSVFTLKYDSASFVIYSVTQSHHEFLVEATVAGSRYLRKSPLPLRARLARVRGYFGDSSSGPTPSLLYSCTWCADPVPGTSVALSFRDGRLTVVKWTYTID